MPVSSFLTDPEGDALTFRIVSAAQRHRAPVRRRDARGVHARPGLRRRRELHRHRRRRLLAVGAEDRDGAGQRRAAACALDFAQRRPELALGNLLRPVVIGDFADQAGVVLPSSYLQFVSTSPAAATITASGLVRALGNGSAALVVSSHGIQAATVVTVGVPILRQDQLLYVEGLDVAPEAFTLSSQAGRRQLGVGTDESFALTNTSTGTRYYVSNPAIVSVDASGLVTALALGDATITVIHGPAERVIAIRVAAPQYGPVQVGTHGGVVSSPDDIHVGVAPGAVTGTTTVTVTKVEVANLPLAQPDGFDVIGAFRLDAGLPVFGQSLQIAMRMPAGVAPGTKLYLFRVSEIPDATGMWTPIWLEVETATVGEDGYARTNTPPYPGATLTGTYAFGAGPPGGVSTIRGEVHATYTIGINDGGAAFAMAAPLGGGAAVGVFASLTTGFIMDAVVGVHFLTIVQIPREGLPIVTPVGNVEVHPGRVATPSFVLTTPPPPAGPWSPPVITSAHLEFTANGPEVVLTGERFTYDNPLAPGTRKLGSGPTDARVLFEIPGWSTPIEAIPLASSTATELRVVVPPAVTLSLARISVARPQYQYGNGTYDVLVNKDSNSVELAPVDVYVIAAMGGREVAVVNAFTGSLAARIPIADNFHSCPLLQPCASTRASAISPDGTRAYVSLRFSNGIAVIDMEALHEVDVNPATSAIDEIRLPAGANPFWLVVSPRGDVLYVSDELSSNVYAITVDPRSPDYHKVRTLPLSLATDGLRGMDISSDGRRLYVAATGLGTAAVRTGQPVPPGSIVIFDVDPESPNFQTQVGVVAADREPYGVTATPDPLVITFTNRDTDVNGFGVLRASTNRNSGTVDYVSLSLGSTQDYLDVNNGTGIAILPDLSYAFVTGYNKYVQGVPSHDPDYDPLRPAGGNVGIIKDPLGLHGTPQLVAATRPIPLGFPDNLVLSADGKYLYVAYGGPGAMFVFSVTAMLTELNDPANAQLLDRRPIDDLVSGVVAPNMAIDVRADYRLLGTQSHPFFGVPPGSTQGPIAVGGLTRGVAIKPDPIPVLHIDGPDLVQLRTHIDRVNCTVCSSADPFVFTLDTAAKVTMRINGAIATGIPNPADGGATQLSQFSDVVLAPGTYLIFLRPVDQLGLPGRYQYELKAVALADPSNIGSDTGTIENALEINSSLTVGHTIIKGVDIWDGHVTVSSQDVAIAGRGLSLDFSRSYSSSGSYDQGPLGAGWTHSYNVRLVWDDLCATYTIVGGEGSGNAFLIGSGHTDPALAALWGLPAGARFFTPQVGYHSILVQVDPQHDPDSFEFYTKDHTRYHFEFAPAQQPTNHAYQLKFIEDSNGNRVELYYHRNDPRLSSLPPTLQAMIDGDPTTLDAVRDSSGRALVFRYELKARSLRIVELRGYSPDPANFTLGNLVVHYGYDLDGNLTSVHRDGVLPSETRQETYTYTPGFSLTSHNLLTYTDPNGNTTTYTYYGSGGPSLGIPGFPAAFGVEAYEFVKDVTEEETADHAAPVTHFEYLIAASKRVVTDARPGIGPTTYTVDNYGAVIKTEEPLGATTTTEWATPDTPRPGPIPGAGIDVLVVSQTDALGRRTSYRYDAMGNVLEVKVEFLERGGRFRS